MELRENEILGLEVVNIPWYTPDTWGDLEEVSTDEVGSYDDYLDRVLRIIDLCLENKKPHGFVKVDILELDIWLADMGLENTEENRVKFAEAAGAEYIAVPAQMDLH